MSLIVGLTGGIASGKSAVGEYFQTLGVPVLDADQVSRDVVTPRSQGLKAIVSSFGTKVLEPGGTLNRRYLREQVFADEQARKTLEGILHPLIRQQIIVWRDACTAPYCVIMVPLLVKMGWHDLANRLLVVDCPEETQLQRLIERDDINAELANNMIQAQETRHARLDAADDIILNNGSLDELQAMAQHCHQQYSALGAGKIDSLPKLRLPA